VRGCVNGVATALGVVGIVQNTTDLDFLTVAGLDEDSGISVFVFE
jgi:hypothetical protein